MFPISFLFKKLITKGTLIIIDPKGRETSFGTGEEPIVRMKIHKRWLAWRFVLRPSLTAGEGYMDGDITFEDGCDVRDFLDFINLNVGRATDTEKRRVADGSFMQRLRTFNDLTKSQKNVAHHYEFNTPFYDLFLDENRQYTCAYFRSPNDSLEQAQLNKMNHVLRKLRVEPHHRVLDIGCGWGDFARHMNEKTGAHVTAVNLSREQIGMAKKRAEAEGKSDVLDYRVQDYREVEGKFDRVSAVGVIEHVGRPYYKKFFRHIRDLLDEDGVALVHGIGRSDGPGGTNAWTEKYIFPGGYSPAISEIMPAIEQSGLFLDDLEVLRVHYARTAEHWYNRFLANRDKAREMYDERMCRMFEFYLAGCIGAFDHGGLIIFQLQLSKKQDAVPLTREYLYED